MNRKISRITAFFMLIIAIAFVPFALNHPEASWPWSNTVSFIIYAVYIVLMIFLFAAPFKK